MMSLFSLATERRGLLERLFQIPAASAVVLRGIRREGA
jgi:hypothetical protein